MTHYKPIKPLILICLVVCGNSACTKLVSIPPPINTITTEQVFSTDKQATSAMSEVYYGMINTGFTEGSPIFSGGMTWFGGASADEMNFLEQGDAANIQFQNNALLSSNYVVQYNFWKAIYTTIYQCNAVLAGVQSSNSIHDSVKNELTGEAEFTRAFCYFYLVNLFGPVPLVTSVNYSKTSLLAQSSISTIYSSIVADLIDAQSRLPADYSVSQDNQRIIPNKWAATALMARVYLYTGDYANAISQSSSLLNNKSLFALTDLGSVFLTTSTEAIWQLQQSNSSYPFNATVEGARTIPNDSTSPPFVYLTDTLLASFEPGDQRRIQWVDSTDYLGTYYYYPYKYKVSSNQGQPGDPYTEYYTVLRLAEQYLIRAEANLNAGNLGAAISDLDTMRVRANLPPYSGPMKNDSIMMAIEHENQIEFFGEWGHRWLDLKRWKSAAGVLSSDKGHSVTADALLFPIPFQELTTDPNLIQNTGY